MYRCLQPRGAFSRSTTYLQAGWVASPFAYTGTPICTSLHSDDLSTVADAAQWNVAHQVINVAANIPPSMQKVAFLRGGTQWQMTIPINFAGSNHDNVQLSFRDNVASAGDFLNSATGVIPVFSFSGTFTGVNNLIITFKQTGRYVLGLVHHNASSGNWSMFEMEFVIIP
ncbi:MAG TPA: hypothetical protein VFO76_12120 [Candidatus Kapabacteria bacterium]|nr:hypothetical protein [Candidatus Kapabacteria bacterium]